MNAPILIVAIANSIHTLRWLEMVGGGGRPVVLLPATMDPPLAELDSLPLVASAADLAKLGPGGIGRWDPQPGEDDAPDDMPAPIGFGDRARLVRGATIARAVRILRPAVLHSMEMQIAGYASLRATELLGAACPPWMFSNWGSDIFLYRKLAAHRPVLEAVARRIDGCLNECLRDLALMRTLGFSGPAQPVIPASGGADFGRLPPLSSLAPTASRRRIVVKGYHGWSGRAQHILSALHLAAAQLRGFRISVVLATPEVALAASRLAETDGLDIATEPWAPSHEAALRWISEARLMIGVGISDGIGTTLLEAMALGAFPIVACTSCAAEWISSGTNGMIVDPHDIASLAAAIKIAATDDGLVEAAAPRNRETVERRWNAAHNRKVALAAYDAVIAGRP